MESIVTSYFDCPDAADEEFRERWTQFKASYSDLYAEKHDAAMAFDRDHGKMDEFLGTDLWTMFADLSEIPWFGRHDMENAMAIIRELRNSECDMDVRKILAVQPFCDCSFRLTGAADAGVLVDELEYTVAQGMDYFRQKLLVQRNQFSAAFDEISNEQDGETLSEFIGLASFLENSKDFSMLSAREIHALKIATGKLDMSNSLHTDRRRSALETFVGLHPDDIREMENELAEKLM